MRRADHVLRSWTLALLLLGSTGWAVTHVSGSGANEPRNTDWPVYGLDAAETHYSPLDQVNAGTVKRLGLAWATDLDAFPGQIQGTPLVVNGTLYGTSPWSVVFAVDVRTGKLKWRWDPQIPHETFRIDERAVRHRLGPSMCCGPVNRGVA